MQHAIQVGLLVKYQIPCKSNGICFKIKKQVQKKKYKLNVQSGQLDSVDVITY